MPETQGVPEIYADFVQIATGNLGIFLGFRAVTPLNSIPPESGGPETQIEPPTELKAIVRLSQSQAKAFAIMLRRSLKNFEQNYGVIPLSPEFVEQFGPAANEW